HPHGRRPRREREAARTSPAHRDDGDRSAARAGRGGAGGGGRKRQGRDRHAPRGRRRRRRALAARGGGRKHPIGARAMRLGVEAAPVGRAVVPGGVEGVDGRVRRVGGPSGNGRGVAVPGFIDLQVNGFGGVDFLEADRDGYRRAGEALLETGVTGYLPTLITSTEDELVAAMREIPIVAEGPRILGIHLE